MSRPESPPDPQSGPPIDIALLPPTERGTLPDFYRAWLPNGDRVAAIFEWRDRNPGASGGNVPIVATLDGELVGTVNTMPVTLQGLGVKQAASWYSDTIVAPRARGQGLATRLVSHATGVAPLLLAKGSKEVMYRLRKGLGFIDVPNDREVCRQLAWTGPGGDASRRIVAPLLRVAGRLRALGSSPKHTFTIRPVDRFGPGYDELAERMRKEPYLGLIKPASYLNWRYTENPFRNYTILEAADARGATAGAAVVRLSPAPGETAWLIDVIAPLTDAPLVMALVHAAIAAARRSRAATIRSFATSALAQRALHRAGFLTSRTTPHYTYFQKSAPPALLPPHADWNFWHGDSDNELY